MAATISKTRQLRYNSVVERGLVPESRVIGVDFVADVDRWVGVKRTILVAVILPLERRDVLCVAFHDGQQIATNARPWF